MARPPASLPPTSADSSLKVSLIIGSFVHSPLKYDLLDLTIPASQPVTPHPEEHTFHSLPAIHHTFNPEQQLPPSIISAVASVLVVSPWLVLLGLVRRIPSLSISPSNFYFSGPTLVPRFPTYSRPTFCHSQRPLLPSKVCYSGTG